MGELGDLLRQSREQLGLTLDDVQDSTYIKKAYLEALEEERFSDLPHPMVARGFLRVYAGVLGLDAGYVLQLHDGDDKHTSGRAPRMSDDAILFKDISMAPPSRLSPDVFFGLLVLLMLAAVVGGALFIYRDAIPPLLAEQTPVPSVMPTVDTAFILPTPTPAPTDTPTPTITPTPLYYTGVSVELVITTDSWVQVLVDDAKVFEGILKAGEKRNWTGDRQVAARVGNGGGVEAIVNGQSMGIMGEQGQVVDQVWEKVEGDVNVIFTPTPTETVTE